MDTISKLSDLKINQVYYVTFSNNARLAEKVKLLAIINEEVKFKPTGRTEIYFCRQQITNLVYAEEIGIGNTKEEAKANYGKFKYEENKMFDRSLDIVLIEITTNFRIKPFSFHRRETQN